MPHKKPGQLLPKEPVQPGSSHKSHKGTVPSSMSAADSLWWRLSSTETGSWQALCSEPGLYQAGPISRGGALPILGTLPETRPPFRGLLVCTRLSQERLLRVYAYTAPAFGVGALVPQRTARACFPEAEYLAPVGKLYLLSGRDAKRTGHCACLQVYLKCALWKEPTPVRLFGHFGNESPILLCGVAM